MGITPTDLGAIGETVALNVGSDFGESAVFSCMGLAPPSLAELATWPRAPGVIEWMPTTVKPNSHPDWKPDGFRFRDPMSGRLLPRLLQRFGRREPLRLAAVGFSAGSNSGLRELLRNPKDREALSFVASVDGLHAALAPSSRWVAGDAPSHFLDWKGQMAPFAEMALRAARGQAVMVITGNNLPEPIEGVTRTPFAMGKLIEWLGLQVALKDYLQDTARSFSDMGGPVPLQMWGRGGLFMFTYAGTNQAAHVTQAKVVTPRILRVFMKPLWKKEPGA